MRGRGRPPSTNSKMPMSLTLNQTPDAIGQMVLDAASASAPVGAWPDLRASRPASPSTPAKRARRRARKSSDPKANAELRDSRFWIGREGEPRPLV